MSDTNVLVAAIAGIAAFFIASQVKEKKEKPSQQQAVPERLQLPESVELHESKLSKLLESAKQVADATSVMEQSVYSTEDRRSPAYKQKIGKYEGGYLY